MRDELIQSLLDRAEEATIFISSHDLFEVESFASHIGYLENGKLQFSEDLTSLIGRFREVELTFDVPPPIPAQRPSTWMQISTAAAVIRFIESCFDPERTAADVRRVFGEPRNQTYGPMSLRSIFVAMAKSRRETA